MTYLTLLNLDSSSRQHHRRTSISLPELRRDQATREERDTVAGGESLDTLSSARPYAIFGSCAPGPGPRSPAGCKRTDHDQFLTSRAASRCSRPRVHRTQLLGAVAEDCQLAIAECLDVRDSMAHLFWLISIIWLILRNILCHPA